MMWMNQSATMVQSKEGKTMRERENWWQQHEDAVHGEKRGEEERKRKNRVRKVIMVDVGILQFFFSLLGFLRCFEKETIFICYFKLILPILALVLSVKKCYDT